MKLDGARLRAFLRAPDPALPVVLLFGPDNGLVTERAEALGRLVVADLSDPFRVTDMAGEQLHKSPDRLLVEAQSLCLMGGRRLVRVRQAGDACRPALELLLASTTPVEALVVIEADELPASSKLRQLAERSPQAAAIACWRDGARDLPATVRALLAEVRLEASREAFAELVANLGADRGLGRRELEKLALYKGRDTGPVTVDEVRAVVGDGSVLGLEDVVYAALLGDGNRLDPALDRLLGEGQAPLRVLRAAAGTVVSLVRLQARIAAGGTLESALSSLRPPPHFSVRDRLQAAMRRHPAPRLLGWLDSLQEAELRCKTARAPDALICRQALAQICVEAAAVPAGR